MLLVCFLQCPDLAIMLLVCFLQCPDLAIMLLVCFLQVSYLSINIVYGSVLLIILLNCFHKFFCSKVYSLVIDFSPKSTTLAKIQITKRCSSIFIKFNIAFS